jgi:predicted negative regulator of RcsB-dependent stress response
MVLPGVILPVRGDTPGALGSLDHAVAIRPENRDDVMVLNQAWSFRGDLLTAEGRTEEANASYRQAHELLMSTL